MSDRAHPFLTLYCGHCGHALKVKLGCGDRTCPECRLKWFGYHFKALLDLVSGWKSAYFLTLTLKNIPEISRADVQRIRKDFERLRQRFKLILGGFYVVQATNRGKGWHLHLHVLFDGSFISQKSLSEAWAEITGGSFIVDIRKVGDPKTAVRYLLSDFLQAPRIRAEDAEDFNAIFKGSRLVQPFGKYLKTKFHCRVLYKCPVCGEDCWLFLDSLFDIGDRPGRAREDDS